MSKKIKASNTQPAGYTGIIRRMAVLGDKVQLLVGKMEIGFTFDPVPDWMRVGAKVFFDNRKGQVLLVKAAPPVEPVADCDADPALKVLSGGKPKLYGLNGEFIN